MTPPTAALPIADCPFCGGSPKLIQRPHPAIEHVALAWVVQCSGCTAETCSEHRQWAIDYWNRRVAPTVLRKAYETANFHLSCALEVISKQLKEHV